MWWPKDEGKLGRFVKREIRIDEAIRKQKEETESIRNKRLFSQLETR